MSGKLQTLTGKRTSMALSDYRYRDDGRPRIIHFSGGRTSAYLLTHTLAAYGGSLPDHVRIAFCNTGKEREETLVFIQRCSEKWNVKVTWLEYDFRPDARGGRHDPKHVHRIVNFENASRNGEPFEAMIRSGSILPTVALRKCTSELKVRTSERWARRTLKWKKHFDVLGIRYDEGRRWRKALMEECRTEYPLVSARVTKPMVDAFWQQCPFDLGIPSRLGNCDLCFLKGKRNLIRTIKQEPDRARWWITQEEHILHAHGRRLRNSKMAQFSQRYTYAELLEESLVPDPQLVLIDTESDEAIHCFCGD